MNSNLAIWSCQSNGNY